MTTASRACRSRARLVAAGLVALTLACEEAAAPPGAPNVVLITLDGLRPDHLSYFGYERDTSRNIDWLAREGVVFTEMVPSSCSTKISLTSLLTSLDSPRHGVRKNREDLPEEQLTLAEVFRGHGYRTAGFVGSPWLARRFGFAQGFDRHDDFGDRDVKFISADLVVGEALDFLRDEPTDDARPFFLYLHLKEPHPPWRHGSPWLAEPEPVERFFEEGCGFVPKPEQIAALPEATRSNLVAKYDGALRYADDWIGVLLATLRARDVMQRTVIAVSTDHGLELLERYSGSHGYNPFDEVLRGVLVLYDGRRALERPAAPEVQGRIFDIGPTLLGLAGLPVPDDLDGVDLLRNAGRLPEYAFATCYAGAVVRSRTHKLIHFGPGLPRLHGRWPDAVPGPWMLIDLARDPGETRDVSAEQPAVFGRMLQALARAGIGAEEQGIDAKVMEELDPNLADRLRLLGYAE